MSIDRHPRRFVKRFEERARYRESTHSAVRAVRIALGVVLIALGIAIGWLPGPGFVLLAVPGALLLAGEVRWVARLLDGLEHGTRSALAWLARHHAAPALFLAALALAAVAVWLHLNGEQLRWVIAAGMAAAGALLSTLAVRAAR